MFKTDKYFVTNEFKNVDDLREWMRCDGHLWFYINGKYYFMTNSNNYDASGKIAACRYITDGDYASPGYNDANGAGTKILWEFFDLEAVWRAPIFDGKSFEANFDEFIFYE